MLRGRVVHTGTCQKTKRRRRCPQYWLTQHCTEASAAVRLQYRSRKEKDDGSLSPSCGESQTRRIAECSFQVSCGQPHVSQLTSRNRTSINSLSVDGRQYAMPCELLLTSLTSYIVRVRERDHGQPNGRVKHSEDLPILWSKKRVVLCYSGCSPPVQGGEVQEYMRTSALKAEAFGARVPLRIAASQRGGRGGLGLLRFAEKLQSRLSKLQVFSRELLSLQGRPSKCAARLW